MHPQLRIARPVRDLERMATLYVPDPSEWEVRCHAVLEAGFTEVEPFNPCWNGHGRTFADPDGYRVALPCAAWSDGALRPSP